MTRAEMIEMHEDEVKEAIEKAIRKRNQCEGMEGWKIDVVMSNNGNITLEGLRNCNTWTIDEWEGRAFTIFSSLDNAVGIEEYIEYWEGFDDWKEEHRIKDDDTVEEWYYDGENYDSIPPEEAQTEALETFYYFNMDEIVNAYLEEIYEDNRNQEEI